MVNPNELKKIIAKQLAEFYKGRIEKLSELKLKDILGSKNPYLYKAIGTHNSFEIVSEILRAYISSSDETRFGQVFFEPIAIVVSKGKVSNGEGVDLIIEKGNVISAYSIKSGPNPFNSSQIRKQDQQLKALRSRLLKLKKQFDAVLAHGYGRKTSKPSETRIYRDVSGQAFWTEITGDNEFYKKLITYMQEEVIEKHKNIYKIEWEKALNRYNREFLNDFCKTDGSIDWEKLVEFNSGIRKKKKK